MPKGTSTEPQRRATPTRKKGVSPLTSIVVVWPTPMVVSDPFIRQQRHVVEGRLRLRMPASGAFCLLRSPMMMFNGRSAKPWGSFREGAANLDMVA